MISRKFHLDCHNPDTWRIFFGKTLKYHPNGSKNTIDFVQNFFLRNHTFCKNKIVKSLFLFQLIGFQPNITVLTFGDNNAFLSLCVSIQSYFSMPTS